MCSAFINFTCLSVSLLLVKYMPNLVGEFECKLDAKGRLMFPSGLRKQLDPSAQENFMLNRGFERCLTLYPMNTWEKLSSRLEKLNLFQAKNRKFHRLFHNGATPLSLDSAGRLLVPKALMSYAGLVKELVLIAYGDRIELWDREIYYKMMDEEAGDFADLADEVMSDLDEI